MFFSILVPVYNVEKFIDECIQSVLTQSFIDFELLLIDDGSFDNSGTICDTYALNDSRIRVFHKENQGLIHTRRYAIERARGDYYVFLDSDDMLKPNALEVLAKTIYKYKCDCVIYGLECVLDGKVTSRFCDKKTEYVTDRRYFYTHCFFELDKNSLCRKAVKATVFHDWDYSEYYHISMTEDLLQSLEIYKYSRSVVFLSDILYIYRMNLQSITHQKQINIDYTVRSKVLEFLKEEQVFTQEDWNKYKGFCINLFAGDIARICLSTKSNQEKIQLFTKMSECEYYQKFLNDGKCNIFSKNNIIITLFRRGMYHTLFNLTLMYKWIKGKN